MIQEVEHQTSTKCESSHSITDFIPMWQQPEWSLWGLLSWDDNCILYWAVSIQISCQITDSWEQYGLAVSIGSERPPAYVSPTHQSKLYLSPSHSCTILWKLHTSSNGSPNVLSLFCASIFSMRLSVFLSVPSNEMLPHLPPIEVTTMPCINSNWRNRK